nr:hypothetical protein B0A51_02360 [Rachicladosporium sp. CCFEE 5018]
MSSLSPRGSLSGVSSAAVADDFADSLKDLTQNNKYEISNLTIIAKENTEHAQVISKALENHIKKAGPAHKLPALYLLDSIVKNVGTPYTVYLGRSLYSTFMEAYTLVDTNTRKSMEGMLKTWKEPVPGSMDPRPVFPPEVYRPIENALIRARTAALQHRGMPQNGYHSTPTPPQMNGRYMPPPQQNYAQYQQPQQYYNQAPQQQTMPVYASTPVSQNFAQPQPTRPAYIDPESVKRNVAGVISQVQQEFGSDPMNVKTQAKLQALLSLQQVLNTQQLPPESLQAIAAQIDKFSAAAAPQPPVQSTPVVPVSQWRPPAPISQPLPLPVPQPYLQAPSVQPPVYAHPPTSVAPPQAAPALSSQQLGSLAALLQNTQKPSTPQLRAAAPALQTASHAQLHSFQSQTAAAPPPQSGGDLFAALAKAGLVKPPTMPPVVHLPATTSQAPPAPAPGADLATLLNSLHKRGPSQGGNASATNGASATSFSPRVHVPATNAALKVFRPELLRALYTDQPNQCSTCGRRFLSTPAGREIKARHLDWHFRINQRLAESTRAAHHRHWYPDALEWMKTDDFDPSTVTADTANAKVATATERVKGPEDMYVRAPAGMTKTQCPICYEEMRSSHPEEVQDWVFMNATYNGGKIVHATCLTEMTGVVPQQNGGGGSLAAALAGLGGSREGSRTPDSVLGKRKAEEGVGSAQKLRREF